MNIPFPKLTPSFLNPSWFNPDSPIDEDAELTALERENQAWLNHIAQEYKKSAKCVQKPRPVPMEEADTDVEVNLESDESEETHDEDEEEVASDSPTGNNDDAEQEEDTSDTDTPPVPQRGGLLLTFP